MYFLNRLFYYGFIFPLSSLPFSVLYFISDGLYILTYRLFGYRKKVVMGNLQRSFPSMTDEERIAIAKKFYKHFCDLIIESLKMFTISVENAQKCTSYTNVELPDSYFDKGKSIIIAAGHYASWELATVTIKAATKHQTIGLYKPLTNQYFDKKVRDSRQQGGVRMIGIRTTKEEFELHKNDLTATAFLIDQAPSVHSKPHFMKFLNQDTAVLTGTEKYAIDYDYPVIFAHVSKPRRGHYEITFEVACDKPRETRPGEITEIITRILEKDIRKVPELWLWSHKRWKNRHWDRPTQA